MKPLGQGPKIEIKIDDQSQRQIETIELEEAPKSSQKSPIFERLVIYMPCHTSQLSKVRISTIAKLFRDNGGVAYTAENFCKKNLLKAINDDRGYIIIGMDATTNLIDANITFLSQEQRFKVILSCRWVTESIVKKMLLNTSYYRIDYHKLIKVEPPKLESLKLELESKEESSVKDTVSRDTTLKNTTKLEQSTKLELTPQIKIDDIIDVEMMKVESKQEHMEVEDFLLMKIRKRRKAFVNLFREHRYLVDYNYGTDSNEAQQTTDPQLEQLKQEQPLIAVKNESIFEGTGISIEQIKFEDKDGRSSTLFRPPSDFDSTLRPNDLIIQELQKQARGYQLHSDKGRLISCRKAINAIKRLDFQVDNVNDLIDVKHLGTKLRQSIQQILDNGKLLSAQNMTSVLDNRIIDEFAAIPGIGLHSALNLYLKGFRSLEELRRKSDRLNQSQLHGLKIQEINRLRIPRHECTQIIAHVTSCIDRIGKYVVIPCGSYRRGQADSRSITILITRSDGESAKGMLVRLCRMLVSSRVAEIVNAPSINAEGRESFFAYYQLRKDLPFRKLEVRYYPINQFGYALIYNTGSEGFIDMLRSVAKQRGMLLRDFGLIQYRSDIALAQQKESIVPCQTEEAVFKELGQQYVQPENRVV